MNKKVSHRLATLFPVLKQFEGGYRKDFRRDLLAGLTVTVMLVPQAMAYAMLAGLPPVIGLYASTVPLIVYALLGTSRYLAVGPVAMVSLLVYTGVSPLTSAGSDQYLQHVLLLAMMVGGIQLLLGLFKAGSIVNYISRAVIGGFTSAAAIIIAVSQLSHFVGFDVSRHGTLFNKVIDVVTRYKSIHIPTLALGMLTLLMLLLLKHFAPRFPGPIAVVIMGTVGAWWFDLGQAGVRLIQTVPKGLPELSFPSVTLVDLKLLLPTALAITFIGYMESYAIAQTFATRRRQQINPDGELAALGSANIVAGLFSGYPVTGGLSRTAVNFTAGARTNLAGLFTAGYMTLTLLFLTPLFYYLPKAILAAIIVSAVTTLFEFRQLIQLIQVKVGDGLTFLATFFITLIGGVEVGILAGIGLSLALYVRRSAHPHVAELGYCHERKAYLNIARFPMTQRYPHVLIIRIDAALFFANTGFVRTMTRRWIEVRKAIRLVIFDCEGVNDIDAVAVGMMENLIKDYDTRNIDFAFARLKGPVRDILTRAGWPQKYPHSIRFRSVRQVIEELNVCSDKGYTGPEHSATTATGVDKP